VQSRKNYGLLVRGTRPLAIPTAAGDATVSQILSNPTGFTGQHVTVSGTAQFVRARTSRRGNNYETFSLCEQACLNVLGAAQRPGFAL
jgi:hypothetical protein